MLDDTTTFWRLFRWWLAIAALPMAWPLLVLLSIVIPGGIRFEGVDTSDVAMGDLEKDVVRKVGPPSRVVDEVTADCRSRGGVREIVYEIRIIRLGGWIPSSPSSADIFCLNPAGAVVGSMSFV